MTAEQKDALEFDEVISLISNKVFIIDTPALKDANGKLISGGFDFLSTLISFTSGKVHFISTGQETHEDLNKWIHLWQIPSNQFFISQQVYNPSESVIKLVQGLSRPNPGQVIVLTNSSEFEESITKECSQVFRVIKVDNRADDFGYHKVWLEFHNPEFWKKQ